MKRLLFVLLLSLTATTAEARVPLLYRLFHVPVVEKKEVIVEANRLLVVTEPTWCPPCRALDPHLEQLKKEGYDVHEFTLSQWARAKPKPLNTPDPGKNARLGVPTVMYVLATEEVNEVVKTHKGGKSVTAEYMKKFLRKPESKDVKE